MPAQAACENEVAADQFTSQSLREDGLSVDLTDISSSTITFTSTDVEFMDATEGMVKARIYQGTLDGRPVSIGVELTTVPSSAAIKSLDDSDGKLRKITLMDDSQHIIVLRN